MNIRLSQVYQNRGLSKRPSKGSQTLRFCSMAVKSTYASGALSFDLRDISTSDCTERLGKLSIRDRMTIHTPHYLPVSSRGCVPHISQDMARNRTSIKGIYVALEDCKFSTLDVGCEYFSSRMINLAIELASHRKGHQPDSVYL